MPGIVVLFRLCAAGTELCTITHCPKLNLYNSYVSKYLTSKSSQPMISAKVSKSVSIYICLEHFVVFNNFVYIFSVYFIWTLPK